KPPMNDFGKKIVLGHKIKGGHGMEDGIEVLHILARSPATAHFISLKLCRRFVSDDPPPEFVDQVAKTFLKSGGDVRGVLKTILTSPEFYSQAAFRSKVKSPLELVASSLRASDGQTDAGQARRSIPKPARRFLKRRGREFRRPAKRSSRAKWPRSRAWCWLRRNFREGDEKQWQVASDKWQVRIQDLGVRRQRSEV